MASLNELQGEHLTQPILIPSMPESSEFSTKLPNDSDRAGRHVQRKTPQLLRDDLRSSAETAQHQSPKHREVEPKENTLTIVESAPPPGEVR